MKTQGGFSGRKVLTTGWHNKQFKTIHIGLAKQNKIKQPPPNPTRPNQILLLPFDLLCDMCIKKTLTGKGAKKRQVCFTEILSLPLQLSQV